MAINQIPVYAKTPQSTLSEIGTANTALDGTGTIVDGPTGATDSSWVISVQIKAIVTTTDGMVRIFIKKSGGSYRLYDEVPVNAVTQSATVSTWSYNWQPPGPELILESGDIIAFSTEKGEAMKLWTITEDLS